MLSKGRVTHQEMSISLGSKVAASAQPHDEQAVCTVHHHACARDVIGWTQQDPATIST